jgi:putative ATPase
VERGDIILIGATTENPSFEVISALLSRVKVYILRALTMEEVEELLRRAAERMGWRISEDLRRQIAQFSGGDARAAYNTLEAAAQLGPEITAAAVEDAIQRKMALYDKAGEQHYNLISALHKSVRASDPDAALYWLGRMLQAGEDRLYLARRLMRMAIEDIGLADPRALEQAVAAKECVHFLGEPEGDLALGQLAVYLACAPKSDSVYTALAQAERDAQNTAAEPVPMQLRNAPTGLMARWGYGAGYEHAHETPDAVVGMECLPEVLRGRRYYFPTGRGAEQRLAERMAELEEKKKKLR